MKKGASNRQKRQPAKPKRRTATTVPAIDMPFHEAVKKFLSVQAPPKSPGARKP